jgi:hypothetical protein
MSADNLSINLLGIRHHGSGSSKSLIKALNLIQPDLILLEGTEEADALLKYVGMDGLVPPVAMLMYNPKDFSQAVFYPYTDFSPEWQTILFANNNNIPIQHFDLPQSNRFAMKTIQKQETFFDENQQEEDPVKRDPLGFLARMAGFEDVERWWEYSFEHYNDDPIALFEQITSMITALRREEEQTVDGRREELLREAYMRKTIRDVIKKGYKNIAVVCGAWHTAALDIEKFQAKADNAALKGLPKIKMQSTWIPWTFERISKSSGYGAGLVSPAWYRLLFHSDNPVVEWMSKTAELLRLEGFENGSALVIDAVRLAHTLAAVRGFLMPGIDELFEAAVTVFGQGNSESLELIRKTLIIGDKLGEVPDEISNLPLQQDIETQIKSLRLSKYKISAEQDIKKEGLDLRNEFDRSQSKFLHRLNILGIDWGIEKSYTGREKTTMKEYWTLSWNPEFVLRMIEASMYGNDLKTASLNMLKTRSNDSNSLALLTVQLTSAIKADLPEAMEYMLTKMKDSAALTKDVAMLMETVPELVMVLRYRDVRKTDLSAIDALIAQIIPRACVGLPTAATFMDDDSTEALFKITVNFNRSLNLLNNEVYRDLWHNSLKQLYENPQVNGLLRGLASRLLFDSKINNLEQTATLMSLELSKGNPLPKAAAWLEGFLYGSGLLLIHNSALWKILDDWVENFPEDQFQEFLPILRSVFANYSKPERTQMLSIAKSGSENSKTQAKVGLDRKFATEILGGLKKWLN